MKAGVRIQCHTAISPNDAPALREAFMVFVTAANAIGLNVQEANLILEEHEDERTARVAAERAAAEAAAR